MHALTCSMPPAPASILAGQIYGMARPVARYIARNEAILHRYANEDVAVGAWLVSRPACCLSACCWPARCGPAPVGFGGLCAARRGLQMAHLLMEGCCMSSVAWQSRLLQPTRPHVCWLQRRWGWMCSTTTSGGCAATPSGSARGRCVQTGGQGGQGGGHVKPGWRPVGHSATDAAVRQTVCTC